MTLVPGLWDTHVHLADSTPESIPLLANLGASGITTVVDCGRMSAEQYASIHSREALPDVLYTGNFATSTGSTHSRFQMTDTDSIVDTVAAAAPFVEARVAQGADYIKIVADVPGPSQEIINELSASAVKHGKLTIVHAARKAAYEMALRAEPPVTIITHVPIDIPLTLEDAVRMKEKGIVAVPTLVMEEALCNAKFIPNVTFSAALDSVKALYAAGVTILVGTDANRSFVNVRHGEAIWREMELLSDAGMKPVEILRAATQLSAQSLQVSGRGLIASGMRADLVLVEGDPTEDIQALRKVRKVWKAGREMQSASEGDAA